MWWLWHHTVKRSTKPLSPTATRQHSIFQNVSNYDLFVWMHYYAARDTNITRQGQILSHLQPMAELWRNQRGEIGRQHVKAHSCSHFSPCFDHTSPTQTDDGTSQIDHDIGAYVPYSFRTMSRVLLRPPPTEVQGWRRQGQRLNVTAQWRDHLNWERGFTVSMISPVI